VNRANVFVPDTHALAWDFTRDRKLSVAARSVLRAADRGEVQLLVPTIVLAELLSVQERKMPNISVQQAMDRWRLDGLRNSRAL
jgi:hypothetical protein